MPACLPNLYFFSCCCCFPAASVAYHMHNIVRNLCASLLRRAYHPAEGRHPVEDTFTFTIQLCVAVSVCSISVCFSATTTTYNNLIKCITYSTLLLLLLSHPTHKSTNCNVQSPVNNGPNPHKRMQLLHKMASQPTLAYWTCYLCLLLPPKTISRLQ